MATCAWGQPAPNCECRTDPARPVGVQPAPTRTQPDRIGAFDEFDAVAVPPAPHSGADEGGWQLAADRPVRCTLGGRQTRSGFHPERWIFAHAVTIGGYAPRLPTLTISTAYAVGGLVPGFWRLECDMPRSVNSGATIELSVCLSTLCSARAELRYIGGVARRCALYGRTT